MNCNVSSFIFIQDCKYSEIFIVSVSLEILISRLDPRITFQYILTNIKIEKATQENPFSDLQNSFSIFVDKYTKVLSNALQKDNKAPFFQIMGQRLF